MNIIVIRSKTIEKISGTCSYEYSQHRTWHDKDGHMRIYSQLISKQKAQQLITQYGLVETHSTSDGEIYDTPEKSFKALFPKGIRTIRQKNLIESLDNIS